GVVGALPFARASRAFARFDKGATALLTVIAASVGASAAIAWKEMAYSIFTDYPLLRPSIYPQHGLALLAVVATALLAMRFGRSGGAPPSAWGRDQSGEPHVRVAQHVRVSDAAQGELYAAAADETTED